MSEAISEFWSLVSIKNSLLDDFEISKKKLKKLRIDEVGNKNFIIHLIAEMNFTKEIVKKIDSYIDKFSNQCRLECNVS